MIKFIFQYFDTRRNFSLVARYSLKFTRCSLLVVKSLDARCKNSLVVKNHSLLVAKFDRYLLHKFTKKSQLNLVMDDKI